MTTFFYSLACNYELRGGFVPLLLRTMRHTMADITHTIRSLLGKARSTDNPHETHAFYTKAHELMVKFNIEEDTLNSRSDLRLGDEYWDGDQKWLWVVSHCAAKLIGVSVFRGPRGNHFGGRPLNVEMAEEVFKHYVDQVNKYYRLALPRGMSQADRSVFRRNFKEGAAQIIWHRVLEIIAANTRALIVSPLQLAAEVIELSGGAAIPKEKELIIRHNSVGTQAGRIAGHLVELGKEIKQ